MPWKAMREMTIPHTHTWVNLIYSDNIPLKQPLNILGNASEIPTVKENELKVYVNQQK